MLLLLLLLVMPLKEPVKPGKRKPHSLDKYKGKPWFREIVKLDTEASYLDHHKDKPWYAKVAQADRDRLYKELLMYRKKRAILQAKPSDAEEAEP